MIIEPALISPLRWIDTTKINKSFDGDFAARQLRWYQSKKCYFQPFNSGDRLVMQIISDAQPEDLDIVDCYTNSVEASIPFAEVVGVNFVDFPTYKVYELDYSLTGVPLGKYYASLEDYTSEPFEVATSHENTVLIKYKHSDNDFDVVFSTQIEFQIRVEALVDYVTPKTNRDVYYDQPYNSTQLNSVTFRNFKLYLGYSFGVPQWMVDKIANVIGCDQVSYDDVPYQVTNEAEWEVEKNEDNNFMGASIEIQPVNNNFIKYITTGETPPDSFKPMQKIVTRDNVGGNISIAGVFKNKSYLQEVLVEKSGADYTLSVGTTDGGNEIGDFLINDNTGVSFEVAWLFRGNATVYLSGTGINADTITLLYKQLDVADISTLPAPPQDGEKKNSMKFWQGSEEDFNDTWDTVTGLGKANTGWEKWCISGTNGTTDFSNELMYGIPIDGDFTQLGDSRGAATVTIAKENLPAEGLHMFTPDVVASGTPSADSKIARARSNGSQALNYEIVVGSSDVTLGRTSNMGSGVPLTITPKGKYVLPIVKLVD